MNISENISGFAPEELFRPAQRENNPKRRNLLVNLRQAKHFPAVPSETLGLFDRLGRRIHDVLPDGRTLVTAFAETATALGARAAGYIAGCGRDIFFLHTTRENIPRKYLIADFSEEHSHASSQLLFCKEGKAVFQDISNIVFIDDELTTGKTIINCVNEIKPAAAGCRFFAASLINGMNGENLRRFDEFGITPLWLVKTENSGELMERDLEISPEKDCAARDIKADDIRIIREKFPCDPRLGCGGGEYIRRCEELAQSILEKISEELPEKIPGNEIAVIGTEECMLPSIILGDLLEKRGYSVRCRSTTRSPIVPGRTEGYPLFSRYPLRSVYEKERRVFLYNSKPCSLAILVTDAALDSGRLAETVGAALAEKSIGVILETGSERL